jgi:hypothetical protein
MLNKLMGMLRTEGTIMTADNSNPIATKIDARRPFASPSHSN